MMVRSVLAAAAVVAVSVASTDINSPLLRRPFPRCYKDKECTLETDAIPEAEKSDHKLSGHCGDGAMYILNENDVVGSKTCLPVCTENCVHETQTCSVASLVDPKYTQDPEEYLNAAVAYRDRMQETNGQLEYSRQQELTANAEAAAKKQRDKFNDIGDCLGQKVCDGQKDNQCAPFFAAYQSAHAWSLNLYSEEYFHAAIERCYGLDLGDLSGKRASFHPDGTYQMKKEAEDGSLLDELETLDITAPCKDENRFPEFTTEHYQKYKAEAIASKEDLDYAAHFLRKCLALPIVCDGENAALTELLAEKKVRDQRKVDFEAFQTQRRDSLQDAEKQAACDTCSPTNTEEQKCVKYSKENGYDGNCEFKCLPYTANHHDCLFGSDREAGYDIKNRDESEVIGFMWPLAEDSPSGRFSSCCETFEWPSIRYEYEPSNSTAIPQTSGWHYYQHDMCARYSVPSDNYDSLIYGFGHDWRGMGGIREWKCIEQDDPTKKTDIELLEEEEAAAEDEAFENEGKNAYNAEEAKDLKGSDYGRTWTCQTILYPNGFPAAASHPFLGKTIQDVRDACAGSAEQLCFDNSLSEDDACYAPIKIEDDGSFAEKYGEVEAPDGCPACVCPSGAGLLRMSEEDGDSSSDAAATTIAAAAPIVMALLA